MLAVLYREGIINHGNRRPSLQVFQNIAQLTTSDHL